MFAFFKDILKMISEMKLLALLAYLGGEGGAMDVKNVSL